MGFLLAFLAGASAFMIANSIYEMMQVKKSEKFALYDEVSSYEDTEDMKMVKSIESRSYMEKIRILLESSNTPLDLQEFIVLCTSIYIFVSLMAFSFTGSIMMALFVGAVPLFVIYTFLNNKVKNKNKRVVSQLPDFSIMFASGYQVGYSVENCFDYCAKELRFPINVEMREIYNDITEKKLTLVTALNNWYERNPNEDILFVIKGLLLCQEKSGDVSTIMKSLQEKLRGRQYVHRFITKRTQGLRFTARIIQVVPMLALILTIVSNPEKFNKFATSLFGTIGFIFCAICYTIGIFLIRRFIKNVYKD